MHGNRDRAIALAFWFALSSALVPGWAAAHDPDEATQPPHHECHGQGSMWASIGHPGLGEMVNSHKGWEGVPKRKFWLGFIPGFGWPGYLQVVSAIDAANCRTNDWPKD